MRRMEWPSDFPRWARWLIIWGGWSIAWGFMAFGQVLNDLRLFAWALFFGIGTATVLLWLVIDEIAARERLTRDEMARAAVHARQRREGPRGV